MSGLSESEAIASCNSHTSKTFFPFFVDDVIVVMMAIQSVGIQSLFAYINMKTLADQLIVSE